MRMTEAAVSIHNREFWEAKLHHVLKFTPILIDKALHSMRKAYAKHIGATGKYTPHQGRKERARRVRQMSTK